MDDEIMFAAMFFVLRTGIPWRDLPERFGPWGSVYTRFRRWCAMGLFARLLAAVAKGANGELRYIDCSRIKLHQDGANSRGGQAAQAIGRTKGEINTKLAAIVERGGRAVALGLVEGHRHDLLGVDPCSVACGSGVSSATKALTPRTFACDCVANTHASASRRRVRAVVCRRPIGATIGADTKSKESSAASNAIVASEPVSKNLRHFSRLRPVCSGP